MQNDENLNDEAKAEIIALGNAWNLAKTKEEKDAIHAQADAVRKENGAYDTDKDTLVEIKNVDAFDKAMVDAMADGKITKDEDANAQKLIGATVTTNRTTSTQTDFKITTYDCTTTIGKSDIKVEAKTAQSTKNTNIVSTGVNIDITNHYSAYIFYLPVWENEMEEDRKRLVDYYGKNFNDEDIGTASVNSANEFTKYWNSMDDNKISAVIIDTHANYEGLYNDNGDTLISSSDISSLENKKIDKLILYGCNAGHLDHEKDNPAAQFAQKVSGSPVIASDGTVKNGPQRIIGLFGAYAYKSVNNTAFKRQITNGSKRDNKGWIKYQYTGGKITTSASLGKNLTLTQMLLK